MRTLFTFALAMMCAPAFANDGLVPQAPRNATVVHLSETAVKTVAHDRIQARLTVKEESASAETVQKRINSLMEQALKEAKRHSSVKSETGHYSVYQRYDHKENRSAGWEGSQSLSIHSDDATDLLKLTTNLQEMGMKVESLGYYLSNEKRRSLRDTLLADAVDKIQNRAAKVAKQLGKEHVHLAEVVLEGADRPRPIMMRSEMMMVKGMAADAMPQAQADAGEEEVSLTVNATVYLQQ